MQEQIIGIGGWFTPAGMSKWRPEESQLKDLERAEMEMIIAELELIAQKRKCQTKGNI